MSQDIKEGWIFGTNSRTADKSFQLTSKDKLDIHIEAKWTTLRDWLEASYILNGKVIGVSKFSTMSYAIRESEQSSFISGMKTLLEAKYNDPMKNLEFTTRKNIFECQGDSFNISLGGLEASVQRSSYCGGTPKYRFWVNFKVPSQYGWKTNQPKLPFLDKNGYSEDYNNIEDAKRSCLSYIENLLKG